MDNLFHSIVLRVLYYYYAFVNESAIAIVIYSKHVQKLWHMYATYLGNI